MITLSSLSPQPLHNHQIHLFLLLADGFLRMILIISSPMLVFHLGEASQLINMVYKAIVICPLPTLPALFKLFSIILILMCSYTLVFCFQNVPWCYCDPRPVLSGTSPVLPLKMSHLGETLLSTRQITVKLLLNGM